MFGYSSCGAEKLIRKQFGYHSMRPDDYQILYDAYVNFVAETKDEYTHAMRFLEDFLEKNESIIEDAVIEPRDHPISGGVEFFIGVDTMMTEQADSVQEILNTYAEERPDEISAMVISNTGEEQTRSISVENQPIDENVGDIDSLFR